MLWLAGFGISGFSAMQSAILISNSPPEMRPGYLEVKKSFKGKIPNTSYHLTKIGKRALSKYWEALEEIRKLKKEKF